jgi:hypothetical protein
VARVVGRFRMAAAARSFGSWCELVVSARGVRVALTRVVGRMRTRNLSLGFAMWRSTIQNLKKNLHVMLRCIANYSYCRIALCFRKWRQDIVLTKRLLAGARAVQLENRLCCQHNTTLARLTSRLLRGHMRPYYSAWQSLAQKWRTARLAIGRVLQRSQRGMIKSSLIVWVASTRTPRKHKALLVRAASKLATRCIGCAFMRWYQTLRLRRLSKVTMNRLRNREQRLSYHQWLKATNVGVRLRQDARLKAAQIEFEQRQSSLHEYLAAASLVREKLSIYLLSSHVSKEMALQLRLKWKQWLFVWLRAKLTETKQGHAIYVLNTHKSTESDKARLITRSTRLEREMDSLQAQLTKSRKDYSHLQTQASVATESAKIKELRKQVASLLEQVAATAEAKETSDRAAAAHKATLERSQLVQVEELKSERTAA